MPRRDGTGPNSEGSMTGRGLGNCNLNNENEEVDRPLRKGINNFRRNNKGFKGNRGRRNAGCGRGRSRGSRR